MKGDEQRAEALAAYLDGAPLREDVEEFETALHAVTAMMDDLALDADRVRLFAESLMLAEPAPPPPRLEALAIFVADLSPALHFYRDGLGLEARRIGASGADLDAGGFTLQLVVASPRDLHPAASSVRIDLRVPNFGVALERLRAHGVEAHIAGRDIIECRDPDGRLVTVREDDTQGGRMKA